MSPSRSRRSPLIFAAILGLGIALFLPSLRGGFLLDDYYFLARLDGIYPAGGDGELFTFFAGDRERTASLATAGTYPWWIDDELKVRVFRPWTELLWRLDHALFGHAPVGYHAHSLLWWTLTLLLAGLTLRRVLPGAAGSLAFLIFALDEGHALPVAWIANRNALLALAPGLLCLWGFVRWREEGWRPGRALMLAGAVVALLAGELALSALAYVFAYGIWGPPAASVKTRVRELIPLAAIVAVYLLGYRLAGFGVTGSGIYLDPLRDPLGYLAAAAERIPILLAGGIAAFSADLWLVEPTLRPLQFGLGALVTVALAAVVRLGWPLLDPATRGTLRWLLMGGVLSLLPAVVTFPSDRMLLVPGFGLAGVLAVVMAAGWRTWRERRGRPPAMRRSHGVLVAIGGLLALMHLGLAPLYGVLVQVAVNEQTRASRELAAAPVLEDAGTREVVLIVAPDYVVGLYLPGIIAFREGVYPSRWRPLSLARCDHLLRRTASRSLELETRGGRAMLSGIFGRLYRRPDRSLRTGDVIDRGVLRAEIVASGDEGPTRVAFHFDRDLDDPRLLFLVWEDGELQPAALPAVGEEMAIVRTVGPVGF